MNITIAAFHINHGHRHNSNICPVALAVCGQVPGAYLVSASHENIHFTVDGIRKDVPTPRNVKQFMEAYDNNEPVQPFSFELLL